MTNLTTYIEINHHFMTVKEMEQETGATNDNIRKILKKWGWKAISEVDKIREYITAHPEGIIEDICERFECGSANVYKLAKDLGIETLVTRKQAAAERGIKYSLMHRAFNDADPQGVKEDLEIILGPEKPLKRIKDSYNQSGSPFGLADKVKDIKLK